MRRSLGLAATCVLFATLACGGGGGGGVVPGGGSSLTATFTPELTSPGPKSAAMALGGGSGDLVTVVVNLVDTNDVYGAAFAVTFDPARATFSGWSPGSVLETGGHAPTYQVDSAQAGTVFVGATRNGTVPGVDVAGTKALIRLTFRVEVEGVTALRFSAPALFDGAVPPQTIAEVTWHAGALRAE